MDGPDFPDMFKPLASNMGKAQTELRERKDVKWTYISYADYAIAMVDEAVKGGHGQQRNSVVRA